MKKLAEEMRDEAITKFRVVTAESLYEIITKSIKATAKYNNGFKENINYRKTEDEYKKINSSYAYYEDWYVESEERIIRHFITEEVLQEVFDMLREDGFSITQYNNSWIDRIFDYGFFKRNIFFEISWI